jgi:putative redox protein
MPARSKTFILTPRIPDMPSVKKIVVDWQRNFRFIGKDENNLTVSFDTAIKSGGEGTALSPMETLLACLGACTGMDIVLVMKKKRQNLIKFSVEVIGHRRDEDPMIYTDIEMKYILTGKGLNKEAVERAIELSEEKYCSVGGMLKKAASIRTTYEIVEV